MAYLVDSDYLISALANRAEPVATLARLQPAGVSITWATLAEVYEGAFGFPDPPAMLATFRAFLRPYPVLPADEPTMARFGELRSMLRRRGRMIPDFDIVLAATALEHNLTVVTFDVRHFNRIPGLNLYPPT